MNLKTLACAALLFVLSCTWLGEKHEEVWFVEWRMCNADSSAPIVNSSVSCKLTIVPSSGAFGKDSFNFPVDSSGYIFNVMYSEYRNDFLNKNPGLRIVLFDSARYYLDTVFYWASLDFRDQKFEAPHHDHQNRYMLYDTNTVYRDVSRKKILIPYTGR